MLQHDIIVDYVSTQAYPGTAQALARKQQTASPSAGPSTTTNGETGDVEMGGETNGAGTDGDTPMDGIEGEEEDTKAEGPNPFLLSTRDLESIERRRGGFSCYLLRGSAFREQHDLTFPSSHQLHSQWSHHPRHRFFKHPLSLCPRYFRSDLANGLHPPTRKPLDQWITSIFIELR